jgi:uncharacterized membrane protein
MADTKIERWLDKQSGLERTARGVQHLIARGLGGRQGLEAILHGEFLGHPLHAALTDVPVGAWTATLIFDALGGSWRGWRWRRAADATCAVGLGGALLAALPGAADWHKTEGRARKVGLIHGLTNLGIAGLYAGSLAARKKGRRQLGVGLSSVGYALVLFSGWLGGEMSYRYGVGVNRDTQRAEAARKSTDEPSEYVVGPSEVWSPAE